MRLALTLAGGKWADTGGEKGKFGLSAAQLIQVADRFIAAGLKNSVRLLHFHMGSQIANISDYRHSFHEAIRYFGELVHLGLPLDHLDVPAVDWASITMERIRATTAQSTTPSANMQKRSCRWSRTSATSKASLIRIS